MLYEVLAIIPAKYADNEIDGVAERVAALIEKDGGVIERTENLGKMKLAYPIDRVRYGTYVVWYVTGSDGTVMKKIDQNLRLADEVLRHMLVAKPEGVPARIPRPTSYTPPLTPEGRRASEKSDDRPRAQQKSTTEEKPLSAQELDKKLDEILDSDIMKSI